MVLAEKHNIKAVCFDLFSTLVSVGKVPQSIGAFTADILGVSHERWQEACFGEHHDICRPTNAYDNLKRMAHALDPEISEQQIIEAVKARQNRFDYALHNVEEDVLEGLHKLDSAGFHLALISNASTDEVRAWDKSPLAGFFKIAVFSCECGFQKPQKEIYKLTMDKLDVRADHCIFIGDGGSNEHHGAHQCGMNLILTTQFLNENKKSKIRQQLNGLVYQEISHVTELTRHLENKKKPEP